MVGHPEAPTFIANFHRNQLFPALPLDQFHKMFRKKQLQTSAEKMFAANFTTQSFSTYKLSPLTSFHNRKYLKLRNFILETFTHVKLSPLTNFIRGRKL